MSAAEQSRVQDHGATVIPIRHTTPVQDTPAAPAPTVPAPATERIRREINWKDLLQPPDLWSNDMPGLRKVWLYARYGDWTRIDGLMRIIAAFDALVLVLPVFAAFYTFLWLWERPTRRFIAAALITLLVLVLKH